jgi:hypothetical protein
MAQTNRINGEATVRMHLGLKPNPDTVLPLSVGGSPNHKLETRTVRLRFFHFVEKDPALQKQSVTDLIQFFEAMRDQGFQSIGSADEALTNSHAPIWWRAVMSARMTTAELVDRGGRYQVLHDHVAEFIEHWTSLNSLGEVPSGPRRGEVILPGSRFNGVPGDQVTNIIHQLITHGEVISKAGPKFFKLDEEAQDRAGAALAMELIKKGIGFGPNVKSGNLPKLRSRLVVERFPDGHRGEFPDGMPGALKPATRAWVRYSDGETAFNQDFPEFAGQPLATEVRPSA